MNAVAENEAKTAVPITVAELEAIIRRVVREEMQQHSEWIVREMIEFWRNEGPPDLEDDELLAKEALEQIERYKDDYSGCITLEELEAELAAESNELPDQNHKGSLRLCAFPSSQNDQRPEPEPAPAVRERVAR